MVSYLLPGAPRKKLRVNALSSSESEAESNRRHLQSRLLDQVLTADVCRRLGIFAVPEDFRLTVVIPVYNEVNTVADVIERVRRTGLPLEIIVVDDGSRDGTREKLAALPAAEA